VLDHISTRKNLEKPTHYNFSFKFFWDEKKEKIVYRLIEYQSSGEEQTLLSFEIPSIYGISVMSFTDINQMKNPDRVIIDKWLSLPVSERLDFLKEFQTIVTVLKQVDQGEISTKSKRIDLTGLVPNFRAFSEQDQERLKRLVFLIRSLFRANNFDRTQIFGRLLNEALHQSNINLKALSLEVAKEALDEGFITPLPQLQKSIQRILRQEARKWGPNHSRAARVISRLTERNLEQEIKSLMVVPLAFRVAIIKEGFRTLPRDIPPRRLFVFESLLIAMQKIAEEYQMVLDDLEPTFNEITRYVAEEKGELTFVFYRESHTGDLIFQLMEIRDLKYNLKKKYVIEKPLESEKQVFQMLRAA